MTNYSIDFSAGDPVEYITAGGIPFPTNVTPVVGSGNGNAEIPNSTQGTKVESLAPEDMALGQVVPFLFEISASSGTQNADGTVTFSAGWSTTTTNGANFGYDESFGVIAAFVDTSDGANANLEGDETISSTSWFFDAPNDEIVGTFTLDNINVDDTVVVEVWVVLDDTFPLGSGGNVQSRLISAEDINGDAISTGNQTVPLLRVREFETSDTDLSITKIDLMDPVAQGDQLTYEISVTNNGPAIANGVQVVDNLDPNVTYVSDNNGGVFSDNGTPEDPSDDTVTWDIGALAVGDSVTFLVTVEVAADAPTAITSDLNNTVTVTAITDDPDTSNNTATEPTDVIAAAEPSFTVTKSADLSSVNQAGQLITYTVVITNDGNVALTNGVVNDPLVANLMLTSGDTNNDGVLDVGETHTYTGTYTVQQSDIDNNGIDTNGAPDGDGDIDNTVTVTFDEIGPIDASDLVTVVQAPGLTFEKIVTGVTDNNSNSLNDAGDVIAYDLVVTNSGNQTLTNVVVNDPLTGTNTTIASLAPGVSQTVSATYEITQADVDSNGGGDGDIDNTASVTSNEGPEGEASAEALLALAPSIDIVKTGVVDDGGNGQVDENDTIFYTFDVTNTGNVTLDNVVVTDPLPGLSAIDLSAFDGALSPGESFQATASYTITQPNIDGGLLTNEATVTGDDPDDEEVSAIDKETLFFSQTADIDIVKTGVIDDGGDGQVDENDTIFYTFDVTNTGNVTLDNVVVTDPLPGLSAIDLSAFDGALSPGESFQATASYSITQPNIDSGLLTNEATVTGDDPDDNEVSGIDKETLFFSQTADIEIVKTGVVDDGGNGQVDENDTIFYTFDVTNTGNVTLDNVVVTDPLPGLSAIDLSAFDGALSPGESFQATASYTITQPNIDSGLLTNEATVTGDDPDDGEVSAIDKETLFFLQTADIDIVKTGVIDDGGDGTNPGDIITYTFDVTNIGNVTLDNVAITDPLPGLSAIDLSAFDGALSPGESFQATASYSITQPNIDSGLLTNEATVTGDDPDDGEVSAIDKETLFFSQTAEIDIVKDGIFDDGGDGTNPGDIITYTFDVTNIGNVTLDNVAITDPLPGLSAIDLSAFDGALSPGESFQATATYAIDQSDINSGIVSNEATVFGDTPGDMQVSDTDTADLTFDQNFSLTFEKTGSFDDGGDGIAQPGEVITYLFTLENTGNVNHTNVLVEDPLLANTSPPLIISGDGGLAGVLEPGETWTYGATYEVTQDDIDLGLVTNTATASTNESDPLDASDNVPLPQAPSIEIIKDGTFDDGGDGADPGDLISYLFDVTNTGNVTLTNVVITDPLPGLSAIDQSAFDGALSPGESFQATATYAITPGDINAGVVENIATVFADTPGDMNVTDQDPHEEIVDQTVSLDIEKFTNGVDADTEAGAVEINPGDTVTWTYHVTNTGNVTLNETEITVVDDVEGVITNIVDQGDGNTLLDPGETWIYEHTGIAQDLRTIIDFETDAFGAPLAAGTFIDNQYASLGLNITATAFGAMIFDSANPTGGDQDLATAELGNILIISEDGDQSDPDDNANGGTITLLFDEPVEFNETFVLDIEESGSTIVTFDAGGAILTTTPIPTTGDGVLQLVDVPDELVSRIDYNFTGSGATIPEFVFTDFYRNSATVFVGENILDTDDSTYTTPEDAAPGNNAPIAVDDNFDTDEDTPLTGENVLANNGTGADSDPDNDTLTVTAVNGNGANVGNEFALLSGALLMLNADGSFAYDPNGAFEALNNGETDFDSFTYTISDGNGGIDTATVNIGITGVTDDNEESSLSLTIDPNSISEDGGSAIATLTRTGSNLSTRTATITNNDTDNSEVVHASSVTFFGSATTVTFAIGALDDAIVDGTQNIILDASISNPDLTGFDTATATIAVTDDDPSSTDDIVVGIYDADTDQLITTLTDGQQITAADIAGKSITIAALVSASSSLIDDVESMILNLNNGQVERTESVDPYALFGDNSGDFAGQTDLLPEGMNTISFDLYSDNGGNGTLLDTVTFDFDVVNMVDPQLSLTIDPSSISENGGVATGTVSRTGEMASSLMVSLASNDLSEAQVPNSLTIPFGQESADFAITAIDDLILDGTQRPIITASAAGFDSASATLDVTDDETPPAPDIEVGLYNADTDELITLIEDGGSYNFGLIEGLDVTIAATVPNGSPQFDDVESMFLDLNNGQVTRTENAEPYALFGDLGGDFNGQSDVLSLGDNSISFDLFDQDGLGGTDLGSVTIDFELFPA